MEESEATQHIGKKPGDDGWLRLATTRSILPWTIGLALLVIFTVPMAIVLVATDIPTRVVLGVGLLYVIGLFGVAAGCDRAVQLERIRRR